MLSEIRKSIGRMRGEKERERVSDSSQHLLQSVQSESGVWCSSRVLRSLLPFFSSRIRLTSSSSTSSISPRFKQPDWRCISSCLSPSCSKLIMLLFASVSLCLCERRRCASPAQRSLLSMHDNPPDFVSRFTLLLYCSIIKPSQNNLKLNNRFPLSENDIRYLDHA